MRKYILLFITLLISIVSFAQIGFNYKALIKDANGNILNNQDIHIRFTLFTLGESGFPEVAYQERHNITLDNNGIAIATIGEGDDILSGEFPTDYWTESDFLATEIDIEQDGTFVLIGPTYFKKVPMAISARHADFAFTANTALNVSGLEQITENGNTGWRLIGSDATNYGNIGEDAIDLSISNVNSSTRGATGLSSIAMGYETTASNNLSTAMGYRTIASGNTSTALGSQTYASGNNSIAMGSISYASGNNSIAMGHQLYARSGYETVIGRNNTNYTPNDPLGWDPEDRLFTIGASSSNVTLKDALIVLKNGTITAPSLSNSLINTAGNRALITKRYADENYVINSAGDVSIDGDISVDGNAIFDSEIQHTSTGSANLIPIAYGTVDSNGNIETGTGNFTAFLSGNVFIIDVNGTEALSYGNTVCLITPISTAARTSSTIISDGNGDGDADLNVRIFNASGTQVLTTFQFVIYKL